MSAQELPEWELALVDEPPEVDTRTLSEVHRRIGDMTLQGDALKRGLDYAIWSIWQDYRPAPRRVKMTPEVLNLFCDKMGYSALPAENRPVAEALQAVFDLANTQTEPLKRWQIANADEFTDDVEYFVTKPMTRADAEKRGKVIGEAD